MSKIRVKIIPLEEGEQGAGDLEKKINKFISGLNADPIAVEILQSASPVVVPAQSRAGVVAATPQGAAMMQITNVVYTGVVVYRE